MISVLDYGVGNVGSVIRMIERAGGSAQRISSSAQVLAAQKLLIPGVGAFDYGMAKLASRDLLPALNTVAREGHIPILGICLGMQLMCRSSEEGALPGLGWIDAEVRHFTMSETNEFRVPHMGWNTLRVVRANPLVSSDGEEKRFYFVHSYKVCCNDPADPIAMTHYGEDFVSAFRRKNIIGVQFHPEKSHRFGMALMRNFLEFEVA
jgi:glutamine amidotransferase